MYSNNGERQKSSQSMMEPQRIHGGKASSKQIIHFKDFTKGGYIAGYINSKLLVQIPNCCHSYRESMSANIELI